MTVQAASATPLRPPTEEAGRARASSTVTLAVENMRCGGCLRAVEHAALSVPGVRSARANLTARRITVVQDQASGNEADIIAALDRAGFPAAPISSVKPNADAERESALLRRVAVAGFATANIMLLSVSVWSGAAGDMEEGVQALFLWLSALIGLPTVVYAGQPFYSSALAALRARHLNMDVPISLAIILTTGLSLYQTVQNTHQVYFDAAVSLLFLLLVGRWLDERLRARARGEAQNLLSLQNGIVTLMQPDGTIRSVPAHALAPGDHILVAAGERVAADGKIAAGEGEVDQSLITGETLPVRVQKGQPVYAGTLNLAGPLEVEVTAAESQTLLAEIGRLMQAAEQGKARYRRLADRAARIYAPAVHTLGATTFILWLMAGVGWQAALTYAIAVLIITCPCALAIAVPAVQIAATSRLFRRGIVVKAADGLERAAETDMVVFDKTGTLTLGRPQLLNGDAISNSVLEAAAALAAASRHPFAQAIVREAEKRGIVVAPTNGIAESPGFGLKRNSETGEERLGSAEWCGVAGNPRGSAVWYRRGAEPAIAFRFSDALRSDAAETIYALKKCGVPVALLSGDRKGAVEAIAQIVGIDDWQAELKPADKIAWLKQAGKRRKVLMIGDGLNDAPALAAAHASISPASAADISQRTSDFVFQGGALAPVLEILSTSRRARRMAFQNFGIAFCYNVICVPLAMAGFVTPLLAAIVMSTSSILVVANATRLAAEGRNHDGSCLAHSGRLVSWGSWSCSLPLGAALWSVRRS